MKINLKPLSVNKAWQGRRFKTQEYQKYEKLVKSLIPQLALKPDKHYFFRLIAYQSSSLCDWDNPIKPFQDALVKACNTGFDDRQIYDACVSKRKCQKGEEGVEFYFLQDYEIHDLPSGLVIKGTPA